LAKGVVVYGAGGHGKVVAEILTVSGYTVMGFVDDAPARVGSSIGDLPVFAAAEWLGWHPDAEVAMGIGDNPARQRAALRVKQNRGSLITVVHPRAIFSRTAKIGDGAVIMPGVVLNADCEIGDGAIVNTGAIVEHDVKVGHYAHLSPNCTLGGGALIGDCTHIGIGASVLPQKRVGANCVIGAGAVVIDDIPDNSVAYGIPAKVNVQTEKG
jgi:sugar O-acyltransferase (sialic acid O-acetyltransferase NeuD family)